MQNGLIHLKKGTQCFRTWLVFSVTKNHLIRKKKRLPWGRKREWKQPCYTGIPERSDFGVYTHWQWDKKTLWGLLTRHWFMIEQAAEWSFTTSILPDAVKFHSDFPQGTKHQSSCWTHWMLKKKNVVSRKCPLLKEDF